MNVRLIAWSPGPDLIRAPPHTPEAAGIAGSRPALTMREMDSRVKVFLAYPLPDADGVRSRNGPGPRGNQPGKKTCVALSPTISFGQDHRLNSNAHGIV